MGMMILRLWPLVIDVGIWRRWGEIMIEYDEGGYTGYVKGWDYESGLSTLAK